MAKSKEPRSGFEGIRVKGAREHNLKNVHVEIPRNKITVITGLSGSGKSSIAFDTIYAEGQRRYVDSLSTYARNFLDKLKKPDVDSIVGLSPAIAIDQKSVGLNPRSTVGTVTEVYDYLRLLYAKVGTPHCPTHHVPVAGQLPDQIIDDIMKRPQGSRLIIMAPFAQGKKGEFHNEFQKFAKRGFVSAKVDGVFIELEGAKKLAKTKAHDIDIVIDKVVIKDGVRGRVAESVHTAIQHGNGRVVVETTTGQRQNYSIHSACPVCGYGFPEIEPRFFSFNNPRGACQTCNGLGTIDIVEIEEDRWEAGDEPRTVRNVKYRIAEKVAHKSEEDDEGEIDQLAIRVCPDCKGTRLSEGPRNVLIAGKSITELAALSAVELHETLETSEWSSRGQLIADKILKQIASRLSYMIRVGTGYLSLDRPTRTLSGGEAQRIRLATQVGSSLVGVLYVLDEPSIGLHPRDHHRLLDILRDLKDLGNTILLVEHDEDTIRSADHIIDIGPRAGKLGGHVIAAGTPEEIEKSEESVTGRYLSGRLSIPTPKKRRPGNGKSISLKGATGNNLKDVDLAIPLGTFTAITGVSGSGKSTLIMDTLYRILANHFYNSKWEVSPYKTVTGLDQVDKVIDINQNPIGRTPRSTPATYVGLFPLIRDLYAALPDSKVRGYAPGRFSFNVKGGRCENCQGGGMIRVEMHFMSDVFVECDVCQGRRYNRETLAIKYKEKSIADVLAMNVGEALEFFQNHSAIKRKLETLHRVGLDYMTLGQSSTTLSGGEAQRVKLSKELSKRGTGKTLYILDEPTTGLHFADIAKLIELLQELVDQGNTVLVIEHNLDVVKSVDHVVDLGPDGGRGGGYIVATGTPEQILRITKSETARFLKSVMA
ncbi:MAG TPA: excinuclease ABC subunit UvrA [Bdellovibrionales bacterium]|nr:excinuclease ABC subunit UvrA [Bdellovibrionales bacterium]